MGRTRWAVLLVCAVALGGLIMDDGPAPVPDRKSPLEDQKPHILMAICVWAEARGEPQSGKLAVAYVIRNRMKDRRWPDTLKEIILQPMQFQGVWNHKHMVRLLDPTGVDMHDEPWQDCIQACADSLTGRLDDPTNGATHFVATWGTDPWEHDPRMESRGQIGQHKFYWEKA